MHGSLPKFSEDSYAHFVTTNTCSRYPYFRNADLCQVLVDEMQFYRRRMGFEVLGYVIMPDHMHLLLWWDTEEKPGLDISKIMQSVKGITARRCIDLMRARGLERMLQPTRCESGSGSSHVRNLRHRLWQPGFYDHNLYGEARLLEKLEYMHANPVRAGLVASPEDYRWSSYSWYADGSG